MKRLERVVYRTEQAFLGFTVVFDDRWDHQLALGALEHRALDNIGGSLRIRFDRWARTRLLLLERAVAVHHLVLWYLWNPSAREPPSCRSILKMGPSGGMYSRLAHQLARKLRDGRHARRQGARERTLPRCTT